MLRAFVDAGATFPNGSLAPSFTVAGFMAKCSAWSKFQKQWCKGRQDAGIDYFHMTDFEARSPHSPPYHEWNDRKRAAVIGKLVRLIADTVLFGVSVTILKADYDALSKEQRDHLCSDNPYLFCANFCLGRMAKHMVKQCPHERAIYVYESGDKGQEQFSDAMHELSKQPGYFDAMRVAGFVTGLKRDYPHLDSADFLAWEINRHLPKHLGLDATPMRPTLQRVAQTRRLHSYHYTRAQLISLADSAEQENLEIAKEFHWHIVPGPPKKKPKKPHRW